MTPPSSPGSKKGKGKKKKKRSAATEFDGESEDDRELADHGASAGVALTDAQVDAKLEALAAEVAKADAEKEKYESAAKGSPYRNAAAVFQTVVHPMLQSGLY